MMRRPTEDRPDGVVRRVVPLTVFLVVAMVGCSGAGDLGDETTVRPSRGDAEASSEWPEDIALRCQEPRTHQLVGDLGPTNESTISMVLAADPVGWPIDLVEALVIDIRDATTPLHARVTAEDGGTVAHILSSPDVYATWRPTTITWCPEVADTGSDGSWDLLPADQSDMATLVTTPVSDEGLTSLDGMLLGVGFEFTWDDGAPGGGDRLLRISGGTAELLLGTWCGTTWGPAPIGVGPIAVVASESGLTVCEPGEPVRSHPYWTHLAVGILDGVPVAVIDPDGTVIDLTSGTIRDLPTPRPERIEVVAWGGGHWLLGGRDDAGDVTYELFDAAWAPLPVSVPTATPGELVALSAHGDEALLASGGTGELELVAIDLSTGLERLDLTIPLPSFVALGSASFDADRVVLNLDAADGEIHPWAVVLVDRATGELAVIHPGYWTSAFDDMGIDRLIDLGLDGVYVSFASLLTG